MYPSTFGGEACHWAFFSFGRQDDMSLSENGKPTHGNDTPLGFLLGTSCYFNIFDGCQLLGSVGAVDHPAPRRNSQRGREDSRSSSASAAPPGSLL